MGSKYFLPDTAVSRVTPQLSTQIQKENAGMGGGGGEVEATGAH